MTGSQFRSVTYLAAALLFSAAWTFAQQPLQLVNEPAIRKDVASSPRIASPTNAEKKINAALALRDRWVRSQAKACSGKDDQGGEMFWRREIRVTEKGPALLSLFVSDSADCGGVHPLSEDFSLVYDLRTGDPVNWAEVLPQGAVREVSIRSSDGMPIVITKSAKLQALYVSSYKNTDVNCSVSDIVENRAETEFLLYPDAKLGSLVVFPTGLLQLSYGCADPLTLDAKTLESLGISEEWRKAISGQTAGR